MNWKDAKTRSFFEASTQRVLIPHDVFGGPAGVKEVEVAIAIEALAVNALGVPARERVDEGFLPVGSDEEADLARVAGDDIDLAIAGVVACGGSGDHAAFVFANGVLLPNGLCREGWKKWGNEESGEGKKERVHGGSGCRMKVEGRGPQIGWECLVTVLGVSE